MKYLDALIFVAGILFILGGLLFTIDIDINFDKTYKCAAEGQPHHYYELEQQLTNTDLCNGYNDVAAKQILSYLFFLLGCGCFPVYFIRQFQKSH